MLSFLESGITKNAMKSPLFRETSRRCSSRKGEAILNLGASLKHSEPWREKVWAFRGERFSRCCDWFFALKKSNPINQVVKLQLFFFKILRPLFGGDDPNLTSISGWWFQIFFIFTPAWGRFPFWLILFTWVGSTTNQICFKGVGSTNNLVKVSNGIHDVTVKTHEHFADSTIPFRKGFRTFFGSFKTSWFLNPRLFLGMTSYSDDLKMTSQKTWSFSTWGKFWSRWNRPFFCW